MFYIYITAILLYILLSSLSIVWYLFMLLYVHLAHWFCLIFHGLHVAQIIISPNDGCPDWFQFLSTNNLVIRISIYVANGCGKSFSGYIYPGVVLLCNRLVMYLISLNYARLFLKWLHQFLPSPKLYINFYFFPVLPAFDIVECPTFC